LFQTIRRRSLSSYKLALPDLGINTAYRADIVIWQILKGSPGFDSILWFPPLRIVQVPAGDTTVPACWCFHWDKLALPDLGISTADRTDIIIWQILKGSPRLDTILWFPSDRIVNVPANFTFIRFHSLFHTKTTSQLILSTC